MSINRIVLVSEESSIEWYAKNVRLDIQDDGKTLKVFFDSLEPEEKEEIVAAHAVNFVNQVTEFGQDAE